MSDWWEGYNETDCKEEEGVKIEAFISDECGSEAAVVAVEMERY